MNSYSGKFVLRVPAGLHENLSYLAGLQHVSLNQVCVNLINKGLSCSQKDDLRSKIEPIIQALKQHFNEQLLGVVLFGSTAEGTDTEKSDIDLLVVLSGAVKIERGLYRWWDENIEWSEGRELNPHFVSYQTDLSHVSGLWLEIAQNGDILYQNKTSLSTLIGKIKDMISDGKVRRYSSNGHPYWVWRNDEK